MDTKTTPENERCQTLLGRCGRLFWYGYFGQPIELEGATPVSVAFSAAMVLAREEKHQDLVGFYHTHIGVPAIPSSRDDCTMWAWVACLGRQLICAIDGVDGLRAWLYTDDESPATEWPMERFCSQFVGLLPEKYEDAVVDEDVDYHCNDCFFVGERDEFVPTDGRPDVLTCPKCEKTNIFEVDD